MQRVNCILVGLLTLTTLGVMYAYEATQNQQTPKSMCAVFVGATPACTSGKITIASTTFCSNVTTVTTCAKAPDFPLQCANGCSLNASSSCAVGAAIDFGCKSQSGTKASGAEGPGEDKSAGTCPTRQRSTCYNAMVETTCPVEECFGAVTQPKCTYGQLGSVTCPGPSPTLIGAAPGC